ncbi:BT_3928 family protein [uncultured Alistipes sp.]|uniref:BT_3928 family protein n=1 Tax=uncultured Alistipes sp. TaxID=538949 RepID=UPI0025F1CEF2|nr:BT_3928 family protein [uncultured Alistipes sp.]
MRKTRGFKLLANVCRLILACTFIVSGFTKVIDPWGTAMKVNEYLSIYGIEFLQPASMAFSIWLCGAELMMGCMLLFKVRIRLISIFAVLSMLFFTGLTLLSATLIPVEDCGCFGEALKLTPWQTFFKNLALLPMAVIVWWRYRPDKIFAFNALEIVLTCTFFFLSMYLGYYCYRHLPLIDFLPYKVGVNIWEGINEEVEPVESETILVYRNVETGRLREFTLDDTEWQDDSTWEWVDTRTTDEMPGVHPLMSEFSLRDAEGDATEEILTAPGPVYMLCVTSFERLPRSCAKRFARVVKHAASLGYRVICLTPQPLYGVTWHDFGSKAVRCYNIDATTMKTMLRANNGMVVLEDGVIRSKKNCRDIRKREI